MQKPDGGLTRLQDAGEASDLAQKLEALTGKPHPVFTEGEVLEIKGGKWRVQKILARGRMILKTVKY